MKRLLAALLALFSCAGCARAEYAAWLTYWDAKDAVDEALAHLGSFDELICFEAYYDEDGEWVIPEETVGLLDALRFRSSKVYLSLVNDVKMKDGSVTQKSKDFLLTHLCDEPARVSHVAQILELVDKYDLDGVEIDYENIKTNVELWDGFTIFIERLYAALEGTDVGLRVVMECQAPLYADFPEGPEYICMCYNLYGYHSGPGPKADREFLEQVGLRWLDMPGNVHMAFSTGGFLWRDGQVVDALREQDANALLDGAGIRATRDPDSLALTAEIPGDEGGTLWYADGKTLRYWRETLEEMGYTSFDLFRLAGNESDSLSLFLWRD